MPDATIRGKCEINMEAPDVIATRQWFVQNDEGDFRAVTIAFSRPLQEVSGEWACVYRIDGLDIEPFTPSAPIFGVDGVQALYLAMRYVGYAIQESLPFKKRRLFMNASGETPLRERDLGLPIGHVPKRRKGR